jgi:type VI secretion system secreted protein Hcp
MSRRSCVLLAGLVLLGSAAGAYAQEILCTVVGARQGTFQDNSTNSAAARSSQIPVLFLTEEITVPRDAVSGLPTGRRMHQPITIVKELDTASIHFFQAAVTNEPLRSVTCTFYRAFRNGTGGSGRPYFKIILTNATIVEYKDAGDGINGTAVGDERERISMTYESIEMTDLETNATALDDWSAG